MDVGFKFSESASNTAYLTFDDYFIEEIERVELGKHSEDKLTLANGKFTKEIIKPTSVKVGDEVFLEVTYRHYGQPIKVKILRNGKLYGSVILSSTSINGIKGNDVVQIPYIFETENDKIEFVFENTKLYVGSFNIYNRTQYMFR